jgi:hypothetical protein
MFLGKSLLILFALFVVAKKGFLWYSTKAISLEMAWFDVVL